MHFFFQKTVILHEAIKRISKNTESYTIITNTADLRVVPQTFIAILHKKARVITKEVGCSHSASKSVNGKLRGRKRFGRKRYTIKKDWSVGQWTKIPFLDKN
ncbi:hypothetical protein AMECASPLE_005008 [Ameca splendens]|uniref:50S ribosomal protein L23, chloroplastic n=1 Tax=Ameca splendens TaxID=208324 RepID=A0ABV0XC23_9TELE